MADSANKLVVIAALESLVREKALRAISLSGPWGVGKTYLLREFAQTHAQELAEAKLKYVYVSLFGLTSLEAARSRIAANSLSKTQRVMARIPLVAQTGLVDMAKVGEIARSLAEEVLLKNLFVVIDDLERAGEGLAPAGVVGLISELTEQFGCKCVLILNRTKLVAKIREFEEKVFDLTLTYLPTIADVLSYGLPREEDCRIAAPVFEAFGCANIRIAKRLSWILRSLGETTFTDAAKIWPTIVRQATVLAIVRYEYGFDRTQLDKVVERTETAKFLKQLNKELGEEKPADLPPAVTKLLDKIDYVDAGFGACIVDLLEKGALDHPALAAALADRAQTEIHLSQIEKLHGFFQEMKAGFGTSAADFSRRISAFLQEDLVRPERFDLFNLCDLLVQVDASERAKEIVAKNLHDVVSPVTAANREKQLKKFPHLWAAGIFDRIPYIERVKTYTLAECFDIASWEPESITPMTASLAKFTEEEWTKFLSDLRADNAMLLIRRMRTKLKQGDGLPVNSLAVLRKNLSAALEAVAIRDVLFRAKIEDYTDPDKNPGPF